MYRWLIYVHVVERSFVMVMDLQSIYVILLHSRYMIKKLTSYVSLALTYVNVEVLTFERICKDHG